MKIYGVCHICGKPAMRSCKLCGMLTCDKDLDPKTGICAACKHGRI